MKKILLVGAFILSAVTFANVHANHNMANMNNGTPAMGGMNHGSMMGGKMGSMMKGGKCSMMEMKGMMSNMANHSPEHRMAMEKEMIDIDTKKLELRKLQNTANPDAKKVETLTKEIATMEAKHMENMRNMMAMPVAPAKTN